jgi:uncharacterized protein
MTLRGIGVLRQSGIAFDVICVLTSHSLDCAEEIYEFFASIGASTVGFNVDEIEGTNRSSSMDGERFFEKLSTFWDTMLQLHFRRRAFRLREADSLVESLRHGGVRSEGGNQQLDPFAIVTIGVDGSVGTFSPELLGQRNLRFGDFSIGNICAESFSEIASLFRSLRRWRSFQQDRGTRHLRCQRNEILPRDKDGNCRLTPQVRQAVFNRPGVGAFFSFPL